MAKTKWLRCPVIVIDKKGRRKKCGKKCASPAELERHARTAHGGNREL